MRIEAGTKIYHATPVPVNGVRWWENSLPNNEDKEDGGVRYSLDTTSSPKLRAQAIIPTFIVIQPFDAVECRTKADFGKMLKKRGTVGCWTKAENELAMVLATQRSYLKFSKAVSNSNSRQAAAATAFLIPPEVEPGCMAMVPSGCAVQ